MDGPILVRSAAGSEEAAEQEDVQEEPEELKRALAASAPTGLQRKGTSSKTMQCMSLGAKFA